MVVSSYASEISLFEPRITFSWSIRLRLPPLKETSPPEEIAIASVSEAEPILPASGIIIPPEEAVNPTVEVSAVVLTVNLVFKD